MTDINDESTPWYIWLGLSTIACLSFYSQAAVTEERFVPALNVISHKLNIPDDVAGATLMAAGASSPELFSSVVSLFVTHSSLGLGTVVGSELFNQLIICAGAIFASKSSYLELNRAIVTREISFYALSIVLLFYALHDQEPVDDDEIGEDHIFIQFSEACILFGGYIIYVLVCAYFPAILRLFAKEKEEETTSKFKSTMKREASIHYLEGIPFLSATADPAANFIKNYEITASGGIRKEKEYSEVDSSLNSERKVDYGGLSSKSSRKSSFLERSLSRSQLSDAGSGGSLRPFQFIVEDEKPSNQHGLYDLETEEFEERISCFLWQQDYFYENSKFSTKGWNLRWFNFTPKRIYSVADRADYVKHKIVYPTFNKIEADEKRLIIRIIYPDPEKQRQNHCLMAPSKEIFEAVCDKLEEILETNSTQNFGEPTDQDDNDESFENDIESDGSMLDFPYGGSNLTIFFHFVLYPLKALMHFTIPDVRVLDNHGFPISSFSIALVSSFMCLVWLILGSYAMVSSLETLADLLNIPVAVVGATVSAAGTSLPNYIASKCAAEKGLGNMAVSNAFGSNTFNIMVALGLPWMLYTSFGTNFQPYHALRNDGILETVIILFAVLGIFVINVTMSGFKLYRWHAILYIILYIAYLIYVVLYQT